MSPAHVLEPTYRRLKDALLEGRFRAGTKLEAMRLADDFGVSMTPVRDSLNQLVGEGLVDLTPGEGFRVPLLTEQALRDILQVNALLLEQAPDNDHKSLTINEGSNDTRGAYADRLARAFRDIAASSGNRFRVHLVERISDRLHPLRELEPVIWPGAPHALEQIERKAQQGFDGSNRAVRAYHQHIEDLVPALVGRLNQQTP
ncbi:GntR family transcriptional regulator [Qipengyuania flava]|jgi:DNA-binding FadR family transcriptional regulator|uniref:GntR family transcriptional regulator n=3 Tax=Erythrobacteraceae TaxID=335929 RepID=A0A419R1D6_9SPHN|nr:GntR family transcriptional regulator [Erythrobacteraceae bacterium]MBL4897619.1 GntR family transcriptional regulator [Erythrobacter sp.]MCA0891618.1 GntR family transcriptional regulator [Qipengyuania flava]MCD1622480.1 GntR family transcriptional regulator [Citromicrobium bathyomarinum]MXO55023.1 GntR family transcriptional regulator [Qipengyuania pelagi]OAM10906.1 hypothetical protein A0U43_07785 [Citromicrobium sp. RCC1897]PZT89339.1 MAG: GntR family transcriptional regulator [Citromi